jgi:hypothetical protein
MWVPDQLPTMLVDIAAEGLQKRSGELEAEQAVYGLDALSEVQFHPLLAAAFRGAGFGVWPEQPLPGIVSNRPKRAERERCDLVLTESPLHPLVDPVAVLKESDAAAGTLFAGQMAPPKPRGVPPEEAYWLEVKLVEQFCFSAGVPGPNRSYSSELLSIAPRDIPKLAADTLVRFGGLMLILFTAGREVAEHDLGAMAHRCLDQGFPVAAPCWRGFAVPDRIGNTWCTISILPVRSDLSM